VGQHAVVLVLAHVAGREREVRGDLAIVVTHEVGQRRRRLGRPGGRVAADQHPREDGQHEPAHSSPLPLSYRGAPWKGSPFPSLIEGHPGRVPPSPLLSRGTLGGFPLPLHVPGRLTGPAATIIVARSAP